MHDYDDMAPAFANDPNCQIALKGSLSSF